MVVLTIVAIVAIVAIPRLLGNDAESRLATESRARAAELQAQTALEAQRAATDADRSERAHRQALEILPYLALTIGGIIVLAVALVLGIPFAMRLMQQPSKAAPQLPAMPVVYLFMPSGDRPRAEQWRKIERQAGQAGEVTIYQDRKR